MKVELATPADIPAIMAIERSPGFDSLVGRWSAEEHAAELARSPRDSTGTGDDALAKVVPSGHGTDADAGDYLQTEEAKPAE